MCNTLHKDFTSISKEGKGYKIFLYGEDGSLISCFHGTKYINNDYGWVCWSEGGGLLPSGFCFFLESGEAERYLSIIKIKSIHSIKYDEKCFNEWANSLVIKEIEYKNGLGQNNGDDSVTHPFPFKIALTKEFRIV